MGEEGLKMKKPDYVEYRGCQAPLLHAILCAPQNAYMAQLTNASACSSFANEAEAATLLLLAIILI